MPSARGRRPTQQVLLDLVSEAVAARGGAQHVVDLGGGTGGLAADLALAGHRVTVVDPSPDALAAAQRRAAEAGVSERLTGVQGDTSTLATDLEADSVDVLLCHGLLEQVPDARAALEQMRVVLRAGGLLSVTGHQRLARAQQRALAGDLAGARAAWASASLFAPGEAVRLLTGAGWTVTATAGLGLVGAWLPDESSGSRSVEAVAFERELAEVAELWAAAPQIHLLARP